MERTKLLHDLDELMDLTPGTLAGGERLAELEGWTSLAVVGFLALADEQGVAVSPRSIATCQTVDELLALVGAQPAEKTA